MIAIGFVLVFKAQLSGAKFYVQQGLRADRTTLKQRRTTDTALDEETNTNRSEGGGASGQVQGQTGQPFSPLGELPDAICFS